MIRETIVDITEAHR